MPYSTLLQVAACFLLSVLFVPYSHALSQDFMSGVEVIKNVAYGHDSDKQILDIYKPFNAQHAPVIFMVHGGAWRVGDKSARSVVDHKVSHWVSKGFVFVSVNYRMLPEIKPVAQAKDVAAALAFSQKMAHQWGASPEKFILMGHSAGAHLVSLVSTSLHLTSQKIMYPWLGTVALDSAAYNVVDIMRAKKVPRFYKKAFGKQAEYWKRASPFYQLSQQAPPFLAVCSSKRKGNSCEQAHYFIQKAVGLGMHAQLLAVDYSHRKINTALGKNARYTRSIDNFLVQLDPSIALRLSNDRKRLRKSK